MFEVDISCDVLGLLGVVKLLLPSLLKVVGGEVVEGWWLVGDVC